MRILKFAGTFFGTLLVIFLLVFGFNLNALKTLYENGPDLHEGLKWASKTTSLKKLTEYIGQQPRRVAVVSRSGTNPDTTINFEGGRPHTMGTLANFFLITTYARLVESGKVNPDTLISLDEVDRYQLPYIDASNHEQSKDALAYQDAINNNQSKLNDLVQQMVINNDLAIADYLYNKLGSDAIKKTYSKLNISHTDFPLPFSGLYITLNPAFSDTTFKAHFSRLKELSKKEFSAKVLEAFDTYLSNSAFHKKVNTRFSDQKGIGIGFRERRDMLALFPHSTANELSGLMLSLQKNELISKAVSQRVRNLMNWPFDGKSLNNDFEYYGAIYDSRLGLLNGIDYGASTYSKEPFAQAVFFDSLQVSFWFHMSSGLMHQDYQQRLMWDPALRTATKNEIQKKQNQF